MALICSKSDWAGAHANAACEFPHTALQLCFVRRAGKGRGGSVRVGPLF